MSPQDTRHGTYAGAVAHWFDGERPCQDCARAEWRYRKLRKLDALRGVPRRLPARGALRRIQALYALGWTGPQVAEVAGLSIATLRSIQHHHAATIRPATFEAIAAAYERLSMRRPEGGYAHRQRVMAARKGWAVPLAWDDIDNDARPHVARQTIRPAAVLLEEWEHLRSLGESMHVAAAKLGVSVKAIEKARERAREAVA
jgi:transcriptional regulator with XRE-family HTH domain